jgi:Rrf2 family protein
MRLSTKSRYGLRILVQVAVDSEIKEAVKGKDISKKQDISEAYLEQIMIPLKNAGMIKTIRGCNGGYALNQSPKDITVLDIIELFEGELKLVKCLSKNEKNDCPRCDICPTCEIWQELSGILAEEAAKITLDTIVEKSKQQAKPEYVI